MRPRIVAIGNGGGLRGILVGIALCGFAGPGRLLGQAQGEGRAPQAPAQAPAQAEVTDVPPVEVGVKIVDVVAPRDERRSGTATAVIVVKAHVDLARYTLSVSAGGALRAVAEEAFQRAAPTPAKVLGEKTTTKLVREGVALAADQSREYRVPLRFGWSGRGVVAANVSTAGDPSRPGVSQSGYDLLLADAGKAYVNGKTFMELKVQQLNKGEGNFAPGVPVEDQIEAVQSGGAKTKSKGKRGGGGVAPEAPRARPADAPKKEADAPKKPDDAPRAPGGEGAKKDGDGGGDAAPSACAQADRSVTVNGSLQFTAINDVTQPIRFARVELWVGGQMKVAGATGADGQYRMTIDDAGDPGTDVGVTLIAVAMGDTVRMVNPTAPAGRRREYAVRSEVVLVPAGGSEEISLEMSNDHAGFPSNVAFEIYEAANYASRFLPMLGVPLPSHDPMAAISPRINIIYPGAQGFSFYDLRGNINLHTPDVHDWDVVTHEYGHHLQLLFRTTNSPGGPHGIGGPNLCQTRGKDAGIRVAWGEGWPTFFGTQAQVAQGLSSLHIPTVGDTRYTNTKLGSQSLDYDLNSPAGPASTGEGDEVAVQRVLWYLYHGDHGVSLSAPELWALVADNRATTLSAFWRALVAAHPSGADAAKFGRVLSDHLVGPVPSTPADGFVFSGGAAPIFRWTSGNPFCEGSNARFAVRFYNEDFSTLLLETPFQSNPQFIPTAEQLGRIFRGPANGQVHWVVVERGLTTPTTGDYVGRPRVIEDESH